MTISKRYNTSLTHQLASMRFQLKIADAAFEGKHPRDGGKFTSSGGSGDSGNNDEKRVETKDGPMSINDAKTVQFINVSSQNEHIVDYNDIEREIHEKIEKKLNFSTSEHGDPSFKDGVKRLIDNGFSESRAKELMISNTVVNKINISDITSEVTTEYKKDGKIKDIDDFNQVVGNARNKIIQAWTKRQQEALSKKK